MEYSKWFIQNRKLLLALYDTCRNESEILMGFTEFSKKLHTQTTNEKSIETTHVERAGKRLKSQN